MNIKLLLTFDHELPLGRLDTSYHDSLFAPTDRLIEFADRKEVPVTLFTDILCAARYVEWDKQGFYIPYVAQLAKALQAKHDVQLHIHPHWLTSVYANGKVVPSADYSLAHFQQNPDHPIKSIIASSYERLNQICKQFDPTHPIVAFRAGGNNIEPCSKEIFSGLIEKGIKFDSSIEPGYYFGSSLSVVDYRDVPKVPNWFIGKHGDFRQPATSGIFEIPVATIPKTPLEIPTRFKLKKMAKRAGIVHGTTLHEGNQASLSVRLKMLFSSRSLTFDNYTYSPGYLMKILDYNVRLFKGHDPIILATCSHPKTMGGYSFELMEQFVDNTRSKYPDIEFTTFRNLFEQNVANTLIA